MHSSRNVAYSIHERLLCLRSSPFYTCLSMRYLIVSSASLWDDQACMDIVQGILLIVFMRGCSGQGPPNLVPARLFELTSLCLCKLNKFLPSHISRKV